MTPEEKARLHAGRDRYNADIRELVRMGVLQEAPMRRTGSGEERIARALAMVEEKLAISEAERAAVPAGDLTYSQRWDELHDLSLVFYRDLLREPVPLDNENAKLINAKLAAASKVFSINAKIEIAKYRSEKVGALGSLLERIERLEKPAIEHDKWGLDEP